jgi:hypothetical protein
MSEKLTSETISRRKALSLIGIVLGLAASPLTESGADAQEAAPAPATPAPATETGAGTKGMKKRQGRRKSRRNTRHGRRKERHGKPAATAPATTPPPQ